MPLDELIQHGAHVMTVCNACRYCEQYCPVFPAMERRVTFPKPDLFYLASLCHNCGECLYACQYAPPHEFGINVPRALAQIRLRSYEEYAWPRALASAFRHHNLATGLALAAALSIALLTVTLIARPGSIWPNSPSADFYAVMPHGVMVAFFGSVFLFAILAMGIGVVRFARDVRIVPGNVDVGAAFLGPPKPRSGEGGRWPILDALTLRHLHATGTDCVSAEEARSPWRRWLHHCVFYGFLLCFASTSVAAIYHGVFGWRAPYGYTSLPVVLGTLGGAGLLVGAAGLWMLRGQRDPALADPAQRGLDESFIALLFLASLTGLTLLIARHLPIMPALLIVHLGIVLAFFVTLPYGKFVHGLYRVVALLLSHHE